MKILVIDDSRIIRNVLKNILNELKVSESDILEAENGEEALKKVEEQEIGLILVDWNMPKLTGIDFVKIVRQKPEYKTTPILMITSEAAKYNVVEAIKAGVTDYVIKPVQGVVLIKKLKPLIN